MKHYKSLDMKEAYKNGGARERYAMENGHRSTLYINGNKCYKFTYSIYDEYQDANGAIYDTILKCWRA